MHSIEIHKVVSGMISFFYRAGFWHRGNVATVWELRLKWFYFVYWSIFKVSLVIGGLKTENKDEKIFLSGISIIALTLSVKLWILIWNRNQILKMLNGIAVFSIQNDEDCKFFTNKLEKFMKFVKAFLIILLVACGLATIVSPFLGKERHLFYNIAFPLDWKNDTFAFGLANAFILTNGVFAMTAIVFSVIVWYLMLICSSRCKLLGREIKSLGRPSRNKTKMSTKTKHEQFSQGLQSTVDGYEQLMELINDMETFCSNFFLTQFGTSSLCICVLTYSLAFNVGNSLFECMIYGILLLYNVAEIFMITQFGNEIKLSSERLSYCLFESNWIDQPQQTKKCIIIFGEYLKQPHEILVCKLYPLSLDTFTRIVRSAYSVFNILTNFKQ